MVFAQLTWREGLRDIEACLHAKPEALYHLGFREPVAKSTLADANERRDWRLWQALAMAVRQTEEGLPMNQIENLGEDVATGIHPE